MRPACVPHLHGFPEAGPGHAGTLRTAITPAAARPSRAAPVWHHGQRTRL